MTTKSRPASRHRGLVVFSVIAGLIVLLAAVGKMRQGPPIKLLPAQVLASFTIGQGEVGALSSPRGIAVDNSGNLYVADLGNNRMAKFSPSGQVALVWGKKGNAAGEFNEPSGVAVDQENHIYVADAWNGRIQKFTAQGEYLGEISSKAGNFYSPRNVAVDLEGFIYVADTGNSCVKKFNRDANLVKRWGEFGAGRERFQETFGIWVDQAKRNIYVGDAGNRRIKVYTSEGKFIRDLRVKGWQSGVGWPMMTVDAQGQIYAVDGQHNMIWIYNSQGKYLGSWGNTPGKEIFSAPLGITIDTQGDVYISNMNRGQVVKLAPFRK